MNTCTVLKTVSYVRSVSVLGKAFHLQTYAVVVSLIVRWFEPISSGWYMAYAAFGRATMIESMNIVMRMIVIGPLLNHVR